MEASLRYWTITRPVSGLDAGSRTPSPSTPSTPVPVRWNVLIIKGEEERGGGAEKQRTRGRGDSDEEYLNNTEIIQIIL